MTLVYLLIACVFGMLVSGVTAVGLERVAYRPLRKRGAKPLTFLITAIGMSFVLQEFVHYVLPKFGGDPPLGGSTAQPGIRLVEQKKLFELFDASVFNLTLIIIGSALVLTPRRHPDQPDQAGSRDPFRRTGSRGGHPDGRLP